MRGIYSVLIFYLLISCAAASGCEECGMHWASHTNSGFATAVSGAGRPVCPAQSYPGQNITCGCPDLNNSVVVNATDSFGQSLGPKTVYEKVNLSYWADLDISKIPHLVTNMSQVGPDLVLVEYSITVTNIGQVNVTGIWVYDPRLGTYALGDLRPGENATIDPRPYYVVTSDDVQYCSINNVALVQGVDRCCKPVDDIDYASFPLSAKNLETYLKIYSYELKEYGYNLSQGGDADSLEGYEQMLRVQANRLMVLGQAMQGNVSSCRIPTNYNIATVQSRDGLGNTVCPQAASQAVSPLAHH